MRPEGQVSGGGGRGLRLSETELRSKFAIGRAHFQRIIVSQLGGSWGMLPLENFLNLNPLKWLEMQHDVVKLIYFQQHKTSQ